MSDDLLLLGLLWLLCRKAGASGSAPSIPAPGTGFPNPTAPPVDAEPRANVQVGWWWYWFPTELSEKYQKAVAKELRRANYRKVRRRWEVRKTMGGTALGATVIVFYCFDPFRWELPGLPEPAPRGLDTDLSDVAGVIPSPPTALRRMAEQVAKTTWEYLREVYQGRRPPREPFPAP